ncbi:salivary cystatin-L2-like [Haemaphysalis longicornis]
MLPTSPPACAFALLAVGFFMSCFAEDLPVRGGWRRQTNTADEHYHDLAHLAVSKQTEGRQFFDTVLQVTGVETQTVAGTNYRITFTTAESTCPVTATYTKEACRPKTDQVKQTCTAVINESLRREETSVHSFTC